MIRRRRLLFGLAGLAILVVLALPGVQWRLTGWWRGEAFYQGRPASFYAHRIAQERRLFAEGERIVHGPDSTVFVGPFEAWVRRHLGRQCGEWFWGVHEMYLFGRDARAVPVLTVLLDDSDPLARYVAVSTLLQIESDAVAPALLKLRRMVGDKVPGFPCSGRPTVADAVINALRIIDPEPYIP